VVTIDLKGKSTIADCMVVATGTSSRQVAALAERLLQRLKGAGLVGLKPEGLRQGDWVLIDAGDVIVHLFRPEIRSFYNIEKMWGVALDPDGRSSRAGG
jgi:ribosome-associated protein